MTDQLRVLGFKYVLEEKFRGSIASVTAEAEICPVDVQLIRFFSNSSRQIYLIGGMGMRKASGDLCVHR